MEAFCILVFRELLFTAHLEQGELHLEHLVGALGEHVLAAGVLFDQLAFLKQSHGLLGLFGADFLLRMLDDQGFFYMTVFDNWGMGSRYLCAFSTGDDNYFDLG